MAPGFGNLLAKYEVHERNQYGLGKKRWHFLKEFMPLWRND
jgi:hypothetical protein